MEEQVSHPRPLSALVMSIHQKKKKLHPPLHLLPCQILATNQEGATENYEWGIPLFYNPEQEDADSLEDLVKLSTNEATPEHETANHGSEAIVSLKDANDCVDSSSIVSDAAVQDGLPLPAHF